MKLKIAAFIFICVIRTTPCGADDRTEPHNGVVTEKPESTGDISNSPAVDTSQNRAAVTAPTVIPKVKKEAMTSARILQQLQKNRDAEPSLESMIRAALRYADVDPEGSARWTRRAKRAPLLPTMKVTVGYDIERDESLDRNQTDPDRWGADTDNDFGIQISAQWELADLIFNDAELKVDDALADRAERREIIISRIISYYFERQRLLLLNAMQPEQSVTAQVQQEIRIKELSALIDTLTGGILARNLY